MMNYDIILVGASPSCLTLGLHLVDLAEKHGHKLEIALIEKAEEIGQHSISGALTSTTVIEKLFEDWKDSDFPYESIIKESYVSLLGSKNKFDLPRALMPPGMKKENYLSISISKLVRYMHKKLVEKVAVLENVELDVFTGFSVLAPLYNEKGDGICGVQVAEEGQPESDHVYAKIVAFGDKGFVSRDIMKKFNLRKNPQIYSVGVKEVWKIKENLEGKAWHTIGHPIFDGTLGGGWVYGQKDNLISIGMVIGLDGENPNLYPQKVLQDFKKHPWLQNLLKDGELIKYGAQNLPEGGYYSLPEKFSLSGALFLGDALGVLEVSSLSGIDQAMQTGWLAAETISKAITKQDYSEATLSTYKDKVMNSFVGKKLYKGRNFRVAFKEHPEVLKSFLPKLLTGYVDHLKDHLITWTLKYAIINPKTVFKLIKAFWWLQGYGPKSYKFQKGYQNFNIDYQAPFPIKTDQFEPESICSIEKAVFTSDTQYPEGMAHIDEFQHDTCVSCIKKYQSLNKTTPCVGYCTADVHKVVEVDHPQNHTFKHSMNFENCVQCRTCELVCPHENLRVNAATDGAGPNFFGL